MFIPTMFFGERDFAATGGIINSFVSGSTLYKSHTFTSNGTFTVLKGYTTSASLMLIGGGGAGGDTQLGTYDYFGAGGGAGQLIQSSSLILQADSYDITIGAGAVEYTYNNGGNTSISSVNLNKIAYGGGAGGSKDQDGKNGGSGGGAGPRTAGLSPKSPGLAIYGAYGNTGGYQRVFNTYDIYGGGGGGAGGPASQNTGGNAKVVTLRNGFTDYYGFGGSSYGSLVTYPSNYYYPSRGQGGGGISGGNGRSGQVTITYPSGSVPASTCDCYDIQNASGVTLYYTDCSNIEQSIIAPSNNFNLCIKRGTDILQKFGPIATIPTTRQPLSSNITVNYTTSY